MPAKRYSVEQIIAKLREAEKLQGQGMSIVQSCKKLGISDQTYFRWRRQYGALKEDEPSASRLSSRRTRGSSGSSPTRRSTSRC